MLGDRRLLRNFSRFVRRLFRLNWILNYDIVWFTIGHRAQYIGHNFSYLKGSGVIHEGPSYREEMGTSAT